MGPGNSRCWGREPTFGDRAQQYREQLVIAGAPKQQPARVPCNLEQRDQMQRSSSNSNIVWVTQLIFEHDLVQVACTGCGNQAD